MRARQATRRRSLVLGGAAIVAAHLGPWAVTPVARPQRSPSDLLQSGPARRLLAEAVAQRTGRLEAGGPRSALAAQASLPDLQVRYRDAGRPVAVIFNAGTGPSAPTTVLIQKRVTSARSADPVLVTLGEKPVPPLDPCRGSVAGDCIFEISIGGPDDPWFRDATIVLTVDPHDIVKESNERNNTWTEKVGKE